MFEKVNPMHPDKVADRIAGAIVDLAYVKSKNPKIAVECLIGHGYCNLIIESSVIFENEDIKKIVHRISKDPSIKVNLKQYPQDVILAKNQEEKIRCGDNGIFKGVPITQEQKQLSKIARDIYSKYNCDGKYVLDGDKLIICQSNARNGDLRALYPTAIINPLGEWTGGLNVDTGATNRKLGSDMGDAVTGGGLMGKGFSKSDVSVNIYCHLKAQELGREYKISCAIGDDTIDGKPYSQIVKIAKEYIDSLGGFEKFAEWGLI